MKLLIVLSVIACGYAAKLDRTYLPPANAGTSGGSPGSLNTPLGPSGFGQPAGFGQPGANSDFNAGKSSGPAFSGQAGTNGVPAPSNQYGPPSGQSGQSFGSNFDAGFGAPAQNFGNQAQDYQRSQPQRAQASAEQSAQILRSDSQNDGETFSYSFETSNGISAEESGVATNGVQAQGAFAYSDDDGQNFRVQYTADENGYHPQGDHLPTSPPIPDEILKSIEENARAAASGTQEGAYNPDEDNEVVSPQQYNSNAPTSYNQAPTGQNFNQAGKSAAQLYGAPNAVPSPQGGFPGFSQGPSQYNSGPAQNAGPTRPSNGFGQPQAKSPSQLYGSSPNGDARPNSFGQQRPSQQFSAGSTAANSATKSTSFGQQGTSQQYSAGPTGANGATKPTGFGQQGPSQQYSAGSTSANGVTRPNSFSQQGPSQQYSSGSSSVNLPAQPQQYQASPSGQFFSAGRPQRPAQAQDASGYQYNKPQGGFESSVSRPSQQYRPQNGAPSGPQGFSKPSGSNAFPSSSTSGSFVASPSSNPEGPFGPSGSSGPSGPKGPSSFGSNGQASFGSPARPNANFGPLSGSQPSSNGFGQTQTGSNGFNRPQGQAPGSMPDAGYEYNQPSGNSQFGSAQPQKSNAQFGASPQNGNSPFGGQPQGFKSADQSRPSQFGSPRAPPSFSEEEGYKY